MINSLLDRKPIKYSLIAMSIIGLSLCIIIMIPQVELFILRIVETKLLHRSLSMPEKHLDYLFGMGYGFSVLFVLILLYLAVRKNIIIPLFLSLGIYVVLYQMFSENHLAYRLRFPFFALLAVIIFHISRNRLFFYSLISPLRDRYRNLSQIRIINAPVFMFICGGLLGALFFLYIFGTAILDFTYTDWLMADGGDLSLHYLGWCMFRNSAWYFPFGLMDNIVYPFKESILYTDSIPLFAIIFKLLSPVLSENFQYFGLFGILIYIAQGGFGALIIKKIGGNTVQSIIGSVFFILSTTMLWRIYGHTSLAAHFIILLCILVCLDKNNYSMKRNIFTWAVLFCLSVSIHLYFVPMVFIFMFFRLLHDYMISKDLKRQLIISGISFVAMIFSMFCLGAFYSHADPAADLLGESSLNLNAFINPMGMSRFIQNMPFATNFQYEGNAYIGLGIILAVIIFISFILYNYESHTFKRTQNTPYIFGIIFSFLIFSLSPTITLNQYKVFTYPVIPPVEYIWGIFRSTGRYSWPIIYILVTFCIWWFIKKFPTKKANGLLMVLMIVQCVDVSSYFVNKGNSFKSKTVWQSELQSSVWNFLAKDYKHLFFLSDYVNLYSFIDLAVTNNMTLNDSYLARKNSAMINKNKQKEIEYVMREGPRNDTIYIFPDFKCVSSLKETNICFYSIDGILIGLDSARNYLVDYILEF